MKKNFLSNPAITLGLAFLVPILFMFSQNVHVVRTKNLLISVGIAFLLACVIMVIASLIIRLCQKKFANAPKILHWLAVAGFCLIMVETSCFFLQSQLFAAFPESRGIRILAGRIIPFLFVLLVVYKAGFRPLNAFLTIFLCLSLVNTGTSLTGATSLENDPLEVENSLLAYDLRKEPSIYLFFLESYHSLDLQREVYGIDTSGIEAYLEKNDFINYGKVYSNSPSTLLSFADTFSFRPSWAHARGNSDATATTRSLLGGDENNTLFRILKNNGYTTALILEGNSYFGSLLGKFLDDNDSMIRDTNLSMLLDITICFEMLNTRFIEKAATIKEFLLSYRSSGGGYSGALENRVSQALTIHNQPGPPLFLSFKGGAIHTRGETESYSWRKQDYWVQSGRYQKAVKEGNQELQRICDRIIANDPGALIILIGDHGAWRFRDAESGDTISSQQDMIANVKKNGVSWQEFCEDKFAVFLAIRLPNGQRENISYGKPMSHVNLFRHVFAYLNQDKSILDTRAPSTSHFKGYTLIKEGQVLTGEE